MNNCYFAVVGLIVVGLIVIVVAVIIAINYCIPSIRYKSRSFVIITYFVLGWG